MRNVNIFLRWRNLVDNHSIKYARIRVSTDPYSLVFLHTLCSESVENSAGNIIERTKNVVSSAWILKR